MEWEDIFVYIFAYIHVKACYLFLFLFLFVCFLQGQYDFLKGLAPLRSPQSELELHEIENECLGMAVLAITHYAKSKDLPLPGVAAEIR